MPHLLVFSHLRWNFVYQRPQHLLTRLARHYKVVFIEEPVRDEGAPHMERVAAHDDIEVLRPHTAIDAPGFHDDQLPALRALIARHLADNAIDDYVVWFYTPMALPLLAELKPRAVVYDCMDQLSAFKGAPRQLRQREHALLRSADLVLTGGPSLYEAKKDLNANVLCLPSAVDANHYCPARATADLDAMLQAERAQGPIAGPRLGFFGVIDERLDIDLVAALADADPAWQIVMVGPVVKIDPSQLPHRPNIHWLGQQPYALLPQLVAYWDVCLLPFALNESTRFISPTKTLEYMAAEKPVVSTPVHDVVSMYGHVVRIGPDTAQFIDECAQALRETADERADRVARMLATIERYSWDNTAATVHDALERVLRTEPAVLPITETTPALSQPVAQALEAPAGAVAELAARRARQAANEAAAAAAASRAVASRQTVVAAASLDRAP
jgi:glycosyltransferase involved in cell wall biosynthesis